MLLVHVVSYYFLTIQYFVDSCISPSHNLCITNPCPFMGIWHAIKMHCIHKMDFYLNCMKLFNQFLCRDGNFITGSQDIKCIGSICDFELINSQLYKMRLLLL